MRPAKNLKDGKIYAVKTYNKLKLTEKNKKDIVYLETSILERLNHKGIVKMFDRIENRRNIHIIMEHAGDQHLKQKILNNKIQGKSALYKIMQKIASAVEYMHSLHISHNDLKLENIVLKQNEPKIVDFGFGRTDADRKMSMICGTPNYMSPELLARQIHFAKPCDVWALGVIFYFMLHKKFPFVAKNEIELMQTVKTGEVEYRPDLENWMIDLFEDIFEVEVIDRILIGDVVRRLGEGLIRLEMQDGED